MSYEFWPTELRWLGYIDNIVYVVDEVKEKFLDKDG